MTAVQVAPSNGPSGMAGRATTSRPAAAAASQARWRPRSSRCAARRKPAYADPAAGAPRQRHGVARQPRWCRRKRRSRFSYAGTTHAVMMATPGRSRGFRASASALTEGIIARPDEIEAIEVEDHGAGIESRCGLKDRRNTRFDSAPAQAGRPGRLRPVRHRSHRGGDALGRHGRCVRRLRLTPTISSAPSSACRQLQPLQRGDRRRARRRLLCARRRASSWRARMSAATTRSTSWPARWPRPASTAQSGAVVRDQSACRSRWCRRRRLIGAACHHRRLGADRACHPHRAKRPA